jgi:hypothetical protein
MKRIFALLLIMCVAVFAAACGRTDPKSTQSVNSTEAVTSTTALTVPTTASPAPNTEIGPEVEIRTVDTGKPGNEKYISVFDDYKSYYPREGTEEFGSYQTNGGLTVFENPENEYVRSICLKSESGKITQLLTSNENDHEGIGKYCYYHIIGFVDSERFLYTSYGYEWIIETGIFDISTMKSTELLKHIACVGNFVWHCSDVNGYQGDAYNEKDFKILRLNLKTGETKDFTANFPYKEWFGESFSNHIVPTASGDLLARVNGELMGSFSIEQDGTSFEIYSANEKKVISKFDLLSTSLSVNISETTSAIGQDGIYMKYHAEIAISDNEVVIRYFEYNTATDAYSITPNSVVDVIKFRQ